MFSHFSCRLPGGQITDLGPARQPIDRDLGTHAEDPLDVLFRDHFCRRSRPDDLFPYEREFQVFS